MVSPLTRVDMQRGLESFLTHLQLHRNLSDHTLRAYQGDLLPFVQAFNPTEGNSQQQVQDYWASLTGQSFARTSLRRKASALKSFFRFLLREGYAQPNSFPLKFYQPTAQRRLPHFLSPFQVVTLRERLQKQLAEAEQEPAPLQPKNLLTPEVLASRNLAIFELLYSSGIRVSELVGLNQEDVHWEEAECLIRGKGNRERISFMSERARVCLTRYRQALDPVLQAGTAVFLNRSGARLSARSVARMLEELGETTQLAQPLHPHLFRHTFATHLLNQNVDLRTVQELLGHQAITSTQIYTHVTTDRLRQAYLQAHPRAHARTLGAAPAIDTPSDNPV